MNELLPDSHEDEPPITAAGDEELLAALADEFAARARRREHPSVDEYVAKHPALAERIRKLLQAVALIEQTRPVDPAPADERLGSTIGRYKLLERIGEGGFGVVYMAEQLAPVRRKVALKVVKPGMDSRQVLARFEAERQALAIMDHPNIAKVFDGGVTESGRPYFVMELVKGEPITAYCDAHQVPPRQRLELFVQVCDAVQHAHQKGIIHRDIKPTNVLVAVHDTTPVVKVIDFGVAKALGQELTERTLFTGFAQLVGTPLYMSPEQAGQSAIDVDTRSDIYSLGVLLYELLTGTTPFDKERFRKAAQDEIRRIIREEDPPKPSTRLIESKQSLPSISAQRHTEPAKLTKLVRGELDWIVMKALEKDRGRRYETANGLGRDVERYLRDEQVLACPPSARYRLRKLARRYRVPLAVAASFVVLLVGASIVSTWQAVRATRAERLSEVRLKAETEARRDATAARQRADSEAQRAVNEAASARAINDFLIRDLLGQTNMYVPYDRYQQPRDELTLRAVLDRAAKQLDGRFREQPLVEASLRATIGEAYAQLGHASEGTVHFRRALELRRTHLGEEHPATLSSMYAMGWMTNDLELITRPLEIRRRVLGKHHPETLRYLHSLAMFTRQRGEAARAIELFRETLQAYRTALGEEHPTTGWAKHCLAHTLVIHSGKAGIPRADDREIESLYREALAVTRQAHGDGWHTYDVTQRLGEFLNSRRRYEEAEAVLTEGLARVQALPAAPPEIAAALARELRAVYANWGKPERAAELHSQAAAADQSALARNTRQLREQPENAALLEARASLLMQLRRFGEAETAYQSAIRLRPGRTASHYGLGISRAHLGQWDAAAASMTEAVQLSTGDLTTQVRAAALFAYTGDRANYRRSCAALLDSFRRTDNIEIADNVVKSCSLAPASGADAQQVLKLADAAAFKTQTGPAREWFELARALAHYRAGDFKSAAEIIAGSVPLYDIHRDALALSILAMAQYHQGKSDDARSALADAKRIISVKMPKIDQGQTFGDDWIDWLHAQILFREAEELIGALSPEELAAEQQRRWKRELSALSDEVRAKPNDPAPPTRRARLHVRSGRFEQAMPDLGRLVELDPAEPRHWYLRACLLAYFGDEKAYRQHCEAMLRQFAEATDKYILDRTTKASLLLPAGAGGDVQMLAQRAEKTHALEPEEHWFAMLRGIADYRAGRFESAVRWLNKSREADYAPRTIAVDAYLAMAHHQQGQPAEAQAALDRCKQRIEKDLPVAGQADLEENGAWPENWLIAHIARREAEQLLAK